jgi:ADP-dependent phosphofructokinase/glucokinase
VKTENWRKRYNDLLQRLPLHVRDARLTICGLSTCVDGYVWLHEAEALLAAGEGTPQTALARELLYRASAGIGGEFHMNWPEGGAWVEENLRVSRWGVGGSGAQAAQMLAILGAPALMSLEDRSARQLSVIHPNTLVATKEGVVRSGSLSAAHGEKSAHYIFEFTAGTRVGAVELSRSSRTIVRFSDERLDRDPDFARESIAEAVHAGAGILSGFNEIGDKCLEESLEEAVELAQSWRNRGLKIIHLEIGDYETVEARDKAIKLLGRVISSLGMSYSELCGLSAGPQDAVEKACELATKLDLSRLCVHSDSWALTVTKDDPQREFECLLCGCLLASLRAESGFPCWPVELPRRAEFRDLRWEKYIRCGERSVVSCASPYLSRPAGTIGLGDTFLAGTLLVLGGAEPVKANVRNETYL